MSEMTFNVLNLFEKADRIVLWKDETTRVTIVHKKFQHLQALDIKAVELEGSHAGLLGYTFQIPSQEVELMGDGCVRFKDVGGRVYIGHLSILRPMGPVAAHEKCIKPWSQDHRDFFKDN